MRSAQGGAPTSDRSVRTFESDPKEIVRRGWNRVSTIYRPNDVATDVFGHSFSDHEEWLRPFLRSIPRGAEVLDLGCGCGVPDARLLAERFRVTGIDISDVQVERAERSVPRARFLRADMTRVRFRAGTFGGVLCLYALIHVPIDEQRPLLARIYRWLEPGGLLLITTGETAYTGVEENWLGSNAKMYWSHADAATYAEWLRGAGFDILDRLFVPEAGGGHALFLAQRPRAPRN